MINESQIKQIQILRTRYKLYDQSIFRFSIIAARISIDLSLYPLRSSYIEISELLKRSPSVLQIVTSWFSVFPTRYEFIIVQNLWVRHLKYVKKTVDFIDLKISLWSTREFEISSCSFARDYSIHIFILIRIRFLFVRVVKIMIHE